MPFALLNVAQGQEAKGKIWVNSEAIDAVIEAKVNGNSIIVLRGGGQFSLAEEFADVLQKCDFVPTP